jgi:STE24 endopeptidase
MEAAFLFVVFTAMSAASLPLQWWDQFKLEERFGFNTTTPATWWLDRAKGFAIALVIGYPLLVLILQCVEWSGNAWWLRAWGVMMAFQLLMSVLAPVLILPLFNKLTPLPEGTLRDRLLALAAKTSFRAASIQVMDGSRRSKHSNAFFTGFGRFRKIVLFDTLIAQLTEPELEAVLAHEIGHWRKRHITKMLVVSAASSLGAFAVIAWLARQDWFATGFGLRGDSVASSLLLFGLLAGTVLFWLSPLTHWWSRRHEYEADGFAREIIGDAQPLVGALRKLNEKNLSNLTPHPAYSGFYYSHPTLLEREQALTSS